MAIYKNDYNKKDDPVMWELHQIRNKMSVAGIDPKHINNNMKNLLKERGMENVLFGKDNLIEKKLQKTFKD